MKRGLKGVEGPHVAVLVISYASMKRGLKESFVYQVELVKVLSLNEKRIERAPFAVALANISVSLNEKRIERCEGLRGLHRSTPRLNEKRIERIPLF